MKRCEWCGEELHEFTVWNSGEEYWVHNSAAMFEVCLMQRCVIKELKKDNEKSKCDAV